MKPKRYRHGARHKNTDRVLSRRFHEGKNLRCSGYAAFGPRGYQYSNTPLQTVASPNSFAKCFTFAEGKAFVKTSATMSSVGQ